MNEKQSKTRLDAQSSDSAKDLTPGAIYSEIISGCKTCLAANGSLSRFTNSRKVGSQGSHRRATDLAGTARAT